MGTRRILIRITAIVFFLICLEIGSWCLLSYVQGEVCLPGTVSNLLPAEIPGVELAAGSQPRHGSPGIEKTSIHPYLGYVMKPPWEDVKVKSKKRKKRTNLKVSQTGSSASEKKHDQEIWYQSYEKLPDMHQWNERANEGLADYPERRVFLKRNPSRVIVGVFGGSFAQEFSNSSLGYLLDLLRKTPEFSSFEFIGLPMALGGYKQPQQLLSLNYYLALGAEFDVVINLDGFNEIAIPATHNGNLGLNLFYPMNWTYRLTDQMGSREIQTLGELGWIKGKIQSRFKWLAGSGWRFSSTVSLVAVLMTRWDMQHMDTLQDTISKINPDHRILAQKGPMYAYPDEASAFESLVAMWKRASIQMNDLCQAQNITYIHCLQPNQYVPDSKPLMSQAEREVAWMSDSEIKKSVIKGYPLLIAAGKGLSDSGIEFYDFTGIFQAVSDHVYRDQCCHLNDTGYHIVADAVYERVLPVLMEKHSRF